MNFYLLKKITSAGYYYTKNVWDNAFGFVNVLRFYLETILSFKLISTVIAKNFIAYEKP